MRIDPGGCADWQAQVQQLTGDAQTEEARGLRLGLDRRERQVKELQRLRVELRHRQLAAASRSGLCSFFSKVAGAVLAAVSAVVSIYCPPAGAGVAVGAGLLCGSIGIGAAALDGQAVRAKAAQIRADSQIDQAGQQRLELLGALEQIAVADRRVGEFVRGWIDADDKTRQDIARGEQEAR